MKKTLLLKTMFLLCVLIVGNLNSWAKTVTFTAGTDTSEGTSITKEGITISFSSGVFNRDDNYRCYSGASMTITSSVGNMMQIDFTATSSNPMTKFSGNPDVGSWTDNTKTQWTGDAATINFGTTSGQCRMTEIVVTYEETISYTVTAVSNNMEWGTVSGTTTITAAPEDGYRVVAGDGGYTVTSGTATVVNNSDNTFSVTPASDCTIQINFEAIPTHTVTWSVNGIETLEDVIEGEAITFPASPADLGGKIFMGWTETAIPGTTDVAPTFVTSATMGTSSLKYYAVYATGTSGIITTTDNLTYNLIGITGTNYKDWTDISDQSDAVYAGNSAGGGESIQLRSNNSNSGIVSTTSGGNVKKISVTWADGTLDTRTLDIYGKNSAYTAASDLYASATRGTKIGSLVIGSSTTLTVEGDYEYIGLRSNSGAMYFDNIAIEWESGGTTYSGYCTSVPTTATATIPAGKEWITFCSTANLDFTPSNTIEGLKGAYTITAHESQAITLTATEMTGTVKAGTGLLLRAAAVDNTNDQVINIPVAATGEEQTDNMLIGVTEDTYIYPTVDEGHKTNLGLSNGEFHPYSAAGTLAAGKAYLQIPTADLPTAPGAKLIIVFDGEATGIANLNVNDNDNIDANAPTYNLAGQRVNKSYKGVVIVNGKKMLRK